MTKKLEELFDLPSSEEPADLTVDTEDNPAPEPVNLPINKETLGILDKINSALPAVRGLEASDAEMDELSEKAMENFENLMDLGMQVDSRFASDIFSVASSLLGHAVTAKNAKANKKLRMIEMQLKAARLQQQEDKRAAEDGDMPVGSGTVVDRNELLKNLVDQLKSDQNKSSN